MFETEKKRKIQSNEVKRTIRLSKDWELHIIGKLRPYSRTINFWIAIYGLPFKSYVKGKALALSEYEARELSEAIQEIQEILEQQRQESKIIEEVK